MTGAGRRQVPQLIMMAANSSHCGAALAGQSISDVGILKRLKRCGPWFEWIAQALRPGRGSALAQALPLGEGDAVLLTAPKLGETLRRYGVHACERSKPVRVA